MTMQDHGQRSLWSTSGTLIPGGPCEKRKVRGRRAKSWIDPDEFPLRIDLGTSDDQDLGAKCGLIAAASEQYVVARNCVIANLYWVHFRSQNAWLFYSRDNNHYADTRSIAPSWYSRRIIVRVVDELETAGLIVQTKTKPASGASRRSIMRASAALIQCELFHRIGDIRVRQKPLVSIRIDGVAISSKDQIDAVFPEEIERFEQYRRDVFEQNAFLAASAIAIEPLDSLKILESGLVDDGQVRFSIEGSAYHRVWNRDFYHGGRWFGPWWVDMPSRHRSHITINGRRTVELDFQACQPRLMLAIVGEPDPIEFYHRTDDASRDLYARVHDVDREIAKLAVNILINCTGTSRSVTALARELSKRRGEAFASLRPVAEQAIARVKITFPELEPFWATGIGLKLQAVDGFMCAAIQRVFRRLGIPVLAIHDSFIVAKEHEKLLARTMRRVFWLGCLQARRMLGSEPVRI